MLPCECAAKFRVPAIKAKLAAKLKKKGYSQKKISDVLDVTEAAVSQYLSGKRAKCVCMPVKAKSVPVVCEVCGVCK